MITPEQLEALSTCVQEFEWGIRAVKIKKSAFDEDIELAKKAITTLRQELQNEHGKTDQN